MLAGSSWTQTTSVALGCWSRAACSSCFGPGVELLDEDDGGVGELALFALDAEVVADLAAGDEEAGGVGTLVSGRTLRKRSVAKSDSWEEASGWRSMLFGVKTMRGLRQRAEGLTAEEVEVLGGGGGLGDLDVVVGGELEEALHAGAGVLGALAFVAVGEEHDEAGEETPLGFAGGDELVDDDLGSVGEVAELGLPEDEGLGVVAGVAVLEAEDGGFGEHGVVDLEAALIVAQMGEGDVAGLGLDVDHDGVALVEGAALRVLAGEADGGALLQERGEGDEFGHAVVEGAGSGGHFEALLEELFDLGMDVEVCGVIG